MGRTIGGTVVCGPGSPAGFRPVRYRSISGLDPVNPAGSEPE
jgi:hypothetical protein